MSDIQILINAENIWITLYITEGKYWNQLKKFRVVLSSGSHETGSTAKKVTASESAKPGSHIHIIFFLSQGSRVSVEMGTKSEKVCMCVYGALMLELNFFGFQIEENFWEAKF